MTRHRYEFISDLSKLHHLKLLRDLSVVFSRYHLEAVDWPTPYELAREGYRAIVCHDIDGMDESWSIALVFKLGRERKAIWHTVARVDYVLIDPSSKATFDRVSNAIRALYQYVLRRSKASIDDVMVSMDSQLNPAIALKLEDVLAAEGFARMPKSGSWSKRIRSISRESGRDAATVPLPRVGRSSFAGIRPLTQSTIPPIAVSPGEVVRFIGRVKPNSKQHRAILAFCRLHPDWMDPPIDRRLTYMQTLFTRDGGDIDKYVASLIEDAHFIVGLDGHGRISSFMAVIIGYSAPSLFSEGEYVAPDHVVFVPTVVCDSKGGGRWTREGLNQALAAYKMLIRVLGLRENKGRFDIIGSLVASRDIHANLLDALGFGKRSSFSNAPDYPFTSDFYALRI